MKDYINELGESIGTPLLQKTTRNTLTAGTTSVQKNKISSKGVKRFLNIGTDEYSGQKPLFLPHPPNSGTLTYRAMA